MPQIPAIPGLPDWLSFVLLLAGLGFALAFLLMPFAVFGLKSRLEAIEQRLSDTDESLRALARQVAATPPLARAADVEDPPIAALARQRPRPAEPQRSGTPPVPPPPVMPQLQPEPRAEPRIDWPRRG